MNEDIVTIRPLKTDLSVLQHSISFIPPQRPHRNILHELSCS